MNDIRYLLSISELLDALTKDTLVEVAYKKLDKQRLQKVKNITNEKKRAESIGAGLLIQLAVQEANSPESEHKISEEYENNPMKEQGAIQNVCLLSVSELLAKLHNPIETEYGYHENGKPYFTNFPWHFNLSHSEEYVFLVLSEQEVGVDIQQERSFYNERILRRFFTKEEQELWKAHEIPEEREKFFWRMWIRKESYGKLTGEGIAKAVSVNVTQADEISKLGVEWEHYEMLPGYHMASCKWIENKEQ